MPSACSSRSLTGSPGADRKRQPRHNLRLKSFQEAVGGRQGLIPGFSPIPLVKVTELDHHADGHGAFAYAETRYSLRDTIFENAESFLGNPRDEVTFIVNDGDIQVNGINITPKARTFGYRAFFLSELRRYLGLFGFRSRLPIFVCAAARFRDGFGALFVWTALVETQARVRPS